MRFMMLVKHGGQICGTPPKEFMDQMGKLAEDAVKSGAMISSGGLSPIDQSTRVRLEKGQVSIMDGPFAETKEIVGGYAQFEFKSKEEAVAATKKFMELHRDYWPGWEGETEVRQVFGPEDAFPPEK
jgi:hypothetical protein